MTHEVPESFDVQNPRSELQTAAVDPTVGILSFMESRSRAARAKFAERNGQTLEGYSPVSPDDIDDEH